MIKRLFGAGGGAKSEPEPVMHDGFRIFPEPAKEPGGYRVAARIEKEIGGEVKTHSLIRADTCGSLDEATELSLMKAKQLIDQQGDALFG